MTYPLPPTTQEVLRQYRPAISNLGLYLTRYIERDETTWEIAEGEKKLALARRILDGELLADYLARWQAMLATIPGVQTFTARATSRCVVGLGGKGTREVGFRLHPIHGFPLIPGSALKGLARAAAALTWLEDQPESRLPLDQKLNPILQILEQGADRAKEVDRWVFKDPALLKIQEIYGGLEGAGQICFFDAVPVGVPSLELDVMNPHHPQYYRTGGKDKDQSVPPADYESPIPVYFLTVGAGSRFLFALAPRRATETAAVGPAVRWLQTGLRELGVGAKTTSGYGLFEPEA